MAVAALQTQRANTKFELCVALAVGETTKHTHAHEHSFQINKQHS